MNEWMIIEEKCGDGVMCRWIEIYKCVWTVRTVMLCPIIRSPPYTYPWTSSKHVRGGANVTPHERRLVVRYPAHPPNQPYPDSLHT